MRAARPRYIIETPTREDGVCRHCGIALHRLPGDTRWRDVMRRNHACLARVLPRAPWLDHSADGRAANDNIMRKKREAPCASEPAAVRLEVARLL